MKCEICNQQKAETVFFRVAEDGSEEELYVCHACAARERAFEQAHGIQVAALDAPQMPNLSDLPTPPDAPPGDFEGFPPPMGMEMGEPPLEILNQLKRALGKDIEGLDLPFPPETDTPKCPTCGTAFHTIHEGGNIGCANCYTFFRKELTELIQDIQDCTHYPAPPPAWMKDELLLQQLQVQYRDALMREDFDAAEALSKQIETVKQRLNTPPTEEEGRNEP